LFGRETVYPFTAVAEGPCGILQLLKADYVKMVNSDKVFLFNILNYLSSGSQRVVGSVMSIRDGSVAERLQSLVDSLAVTGATDIIMNYKQKDLCSLLGTQRTTLVASLDRLQEDGIIEYDSNELRVLDVRGLLEWNK
jgi:CRP-like cAMP-binding protein